MNPPVNWLAAHLISRELLAWSKGSVEDSASDDSFVSKMNRPNLYIRAAAVMQGLNQYGATVEAAKWIQQGVGFFTDVSPEALAEQLQAAVNRLKSGGAWKFSVNELGTFDFSAPFMPECGNDGCGNDCGNGCSCDGDSTGGWVCPGQSPPTDFDSLDADSDDPDFA